ncbi:thioredoxin [Inquilinus limosus]|uniref:thioredoxin n=1 Tax=Inquilinus limosus TaxID=171674 RepID=UPI00047BDF83|nr:thioredoxin [Inquilinus limosus]
MDALLNAAAGGAAPVIKDSSTAGFRADVIEASMEVPVIVDFWATWCGPCKTLGPILEKQVQAAQGKVRLVKIDIDQNQALAAQLRIQSVPTVYAFYQGRPVDGFMGAVPESQVKSFIDKLVQLAGHDAHDHVDQLLAEAKNVLDAGNVEEAAGIYQHVLAHAPDSAPAAAGLARCLIALGETGQAKQFLESLSPDLARHADVLAAKSALELAEQSAAAIAGLAGLRQRLEANPNDHEARFELSTALYGAGQREAAVDELLELFRRDREWNEQAARRQLVKLFEAMGPTDPLTLSGRRRLSSLLFS